MPNKIKFKLSEIQEDQSRKIIDKEMMIYTPDMLDGVSDNGFLGIDIQNEILNIQQRFDGEFKLAKVQVAEDFGFYKADDDYTDDEWQKIVYGLQLLGKNRNKMNRELNLSVYRYLEANLLSKIYPDIDFKRVPYFEQIKIAEKYITEYEKYEADFLVEDPSRKNPKTLVKGGKKTKAKK